MSELPDIHVAFGRSDQGDLIVKAATPFMDGKQNSWEEYTPKSKLQEAEAINKDLLDLLVCITHHDGAIDFYKERWEPIVKAELDRRIEEHHS